MHERDGKRKQDEQDGTKRGSPGESSGEELTGGPGARGVTRPMAERALRERAGSKRDERAGSKRAERAGSKRDERAGSTRAERAGSTRAEQRDASEPSRAELLRAHHRQTLWVVWTLIALGLWMLVAPATFSHARGTVEPSGGRSLWLSLGTRVALLTWSDALSGAALVVFGWRALRPGRPLSLWLCCAVGCWLTFAPVLLWAPTAAGYLNDTLVGALVIALTVLVPGMPNMLAFMRMGPPTPPGWSYNPSSWPQRWIMIATGFAGWLVSRALAAYQLGYVAEAWDPFFGEGSRLVLDSELSHAWPVSDAALGAAAYTFEFLMGWMGGPSRWRTMPWMVAFFGVLVIPLGLVHIALVISQPVVVGHWCTLCLLAAAIMLPMIPLEVDEVVAMGQHLAGAKRRGESPWRTFWKGGSAEGCTPDERTPRLVELPERPLAVVGSSLWGMSVPWSLVLSSALGLALMALPALVGARAWAAHVDHLGGALVVVVSVISMGEVVRAGRWLNVPLGLVLALGPWWVEGGNALGASLASAAGLLVIALAVPRGPKRERYGSWDRFVR